ncbi:glycosyltransferase [Dyadobacter endophyticus]|uniref:glycosyltransferase n=1 Tax=Dyadobacter endophyticus TaxID=1749036 RepID=UPI003CEA9068
MQSNFPDLPQLPLAGYNITYSRSGGTFVAKIVAQIPKILGAIGRERRWLREMQARHRFDLVISDNRYGLKIKGLRSIIMTHQLNIITGLGMGADWLMRKLHYRILEKFDACWIVDVQENGGLAGKLSHPPRIPSNARYIGLLSQLRSSATPTPVQNNSILILLSGPEPMREMLEEKLFRQAASATDYHFHIVAGNPSGGVRTRLPAHITYVTHANAEELATTLADAQLVICRSGYSTLMDLAMLGKKALLIPTPGQSEQEYLARHLQSQGIALSRQQAALDLKQDIPEALGYNGFRLQGYQSQPNELREAIDSMLRQPGHQSA